MTNMRNLMPNQAQQQHIIWLYRPGIGKLQKKILNIILNYY